MNSESTSTEKDATTAATTHDSNNKSSSNEDFDLDALRKVNFDGKIPVKLTLAQTSLSSAVIPHPMHMLISRQTFLHVGLEDSVRKLHEYALPTLSFLGGTSKRVIQEDDSDAGDDDEQQATTSDALKGDADGTTSETKEDSDTKKDEETTPQLPPYPVCWFEDVITGQPLRWQYFAGVLFDSLHRSQTALPWEIRLHFRSYPSDKLLELCDPNYYGSVLETIRSYFKNSLKQAFVIRYGNPKEALNLSKLSHDAIWDGIIANDYDKVAQVIHRDDEFETEETPKSEDTTNAEAKDDTNDTISTAPQEGKPEEIADVDARNNDVEKKDSNPNNNNNNKIRNNNLAMVPVRLSIDPTKPMIQKRLEGGKAVLEATLGYLLKDWTNFDETNDTVNWKIAGLTPPLSTPLLDLWLALKHPDNFLYISL